MQQVPALTPVFATYGIQAEQKGNGSCFYSTPGRRALRLRNNGRSDRLSHYALHGQKVLKHLQIFFQTSGPLCHQCTEKQAVKKVFPV